MTRFIETLDDIADAFDVAVCDQWGVLHEGVSAYEGAAETLDRIAASGKDVVILSNSGKRSSLNLDRLASMGIHTDSLGGIVTSGEALWQDLEDGSLRIDGRTSVSLYPLSAKPEDALVWLEGADRITLAESLQVADAVLLMGIGDDADLDALESVLARALKLGLPMICSNPDNLSPRGSGLVASAGVLAKHYERQGGQVIYYGKPYVRVFERVAGSYPGVPRNRFLMIGDSLEHDVQGAAESGFKSVFVTGGIHADAFRIHTSRKARSRALKLLVEEEKTANPTYAIARLC